MMRGVIFDLVHSFEDETLLLEVLIEELKNHFTGYDEDFPEDLASWFDLKSFKILENDEYTNVRLDFYDSETTEPRLQLTDGIFEWLKSLSNLPNIEKVILYYDESLAKCYQDLMPKLQQVEAKIRRILTWCLTHSLKDNENLLRYLKIKAESKGFENQLSQLNFTQYQTICENKTSDLQMQDMISIIESSGTWEEFTKGLFTKKFSTRTIQCSKAQDALSRLKSFIEKLSKIRNAMCHFWYADESILSDFDETFEEFEKFYTDFWENKVPAILEEEPSPSP
jgi:hypothetical protein